MWFFCIAVYLTVSFLLFNFIYLPLVASKVNQYERWLCLGLLQNYCRISELSSTIDIRVVVDSIGAFVAQKGTHNKKKWFAHGFYCPPCAGPFCEAIKFACEVIWRPSTSSTYFNVKQVSIDACGRNVCLRRQSAFDLAVTLTFDLWPWKLLIIFIHQNGIENTYKGKKYRNNRNSLN